MKVAAWQAPLLPSGSTDVALRLIRERVMWCEGEGVEILCCPEAILGGLADYAAPPFSFAINDDAGHLEAVLAPLANRYVTTIVGFTERGDGGRLYNSAAILRGSVVAGVYRKLHPAINKSVYTPGEQVPVFTLGGLTFGILICRDSTFSELAACISSKGATALFVPTNNGMPRTRGGPEIVAAARKGDIALAVENSIAVVRADVAGSTGDIECIGASAIVDRDGTVVATAQAGEPDLIVANITATNVL